MKISELPQDLRELAESNCISMKPVMEDLKHTVAGAFNWQASPESCDFWVLVNDGRFDEARKLLNQ